MKKELFYPLTIFAAAASVLFWLYMFQNGNAVEKPVNTFEKGEITLTMYHGEGCQCCVRWADYLEDQGVKVINELIMNPNAFKNENGVPDQLRSCHTAVVDDYIVEGHMPNQAIDKLLSEKPDIAGIALPGMPLGSPGMPGEKTEDWVIYAINHDGSYEEFMRL